MNKNRKTGSWNNREKETNTIPLEKDLFHAKLLSFATVGLRITKEKEKNNFKSYFIYLLKSHIIK